MKTFNNKKAHEFLCESKKVLLFMLEQQINNLGAMEAFEIRSFLINVPDGKSNYDPVVMRVMLYKYYLDKIAMRLMGGSTKRIDFTNFYKWYRFFYCGKIGDATISMFSSRLYYSHILECKPMSFDEYWKKSKTKWAKIAKKIGTERALRLAHEEYYDLTEK